MERNNKLEKNSKIFLKLTKQNEIYPTYSKGDNKEGDHLSYIELFHGCPKEKGAWYYLGMICH